MSYVLYRVNNRGMYHYSHFHHMTLHDIMNIIISMVICVTVIVM